MYSKEQIIEVVQQCHNPELAKEHGMVYQVWEDGEITLQKCGELLWQRSLHSIESAVPSKLAASDMPEQYNGHGYAFVSKEDAEIIRGMIEQEGVC